MLNFIAPINLCFYCIVIFSSALSAGLISRLIIIVIQGDNVVGEFSVVNLCPKEPADNFTDFYRLVVCVYTHWACIIVRHLTKLLIAFMPQFDFMYDTTAIWWRPIPYLTDECFVSGVTEVPGPVDADSIRILEVSLTEQNQTDLYVVSVRVEWDPPLEPYGANQYQVYVGSEPLDVEESLMIFDETVVSDKSFLHY